MIRLRTFVILCSLVVVALALAMSWVQMKGVLEKGARTLEEKELNNISQVVRTAVETKRSELRNYTAILRTNNDIASAYIMAKESGDIELLSARLKRVQTDLHFDFIEILSPEGKSILPTHDSLQDTSLKRILGEKQGLFAAMLQGKPALLSFAPLSLYDAPIGTIVLGYFAQGELSAELSSLTKATITFAVDGKANLTPEIHLRENPTESFWKPLSTRLIFSGLVSLGLLLVVLYIFLEFGFIRGFRVFVQEMNNASQDVDRGRPHEMPALSSHIVENQLLFRASQNLVTSLMAQQKRMKEQVILEESAIKQKELGELAHQVAHDIRSPLSALLITANAATQMPEEYRLLIREAASRIEDIANNLLTKRKQIEVGDASGAVESVQLLSSLIESIVSEKRMQFRQRMEVQIETRFDHGSYGLFALVRSTLFKTVISNLIDNSVDAIVGKGKIVVGLKDVDDRVEVTIEDNGKGIAPEILPLLAQRGFSYDKKHGSGLGLYHARTTTASWGGELRLHSEPGTGTRVTIVLPKAKPPKWFVPYIDIDESDTIVVADDDASIHHIWDKRFERDKILHFSTPQQLERWKDGETSSDFICLVDYEFLGEKDTGLTLIDRLNIHSRSFLVTSRHEDPKLIEQCLARNIRIIPKTMAGFVPIRLKRSATCPTTSSMNPS